MKKIKILIATMLSAIVLVFAAVFGGSVNAAGTVLYDSTTDSNISYTKEIQINTIAADVFKLESIGMDATVETVSSVKYLFFGTSSADGKKGFKVSNLSNNKSYEITLSIYATDSNKNPKGGDTINFGANTVTSSKDNTVNISSIIAPSESSILYVSTNNRRMLLKTVTYEEKTTYSISYNANGHGTAPSTVSNVSSLNETLLSSIEAECTSQQKVDTFIDLGGNRFL